MKNSKETTVATVRDALRQAMRGLASTVSIVAGRDARGVGHAMAATSAMSLSFDPLSMLVCINRSASFYPLIVEGADFCINILETSHVDVANNCATKAQGEDRFEDGKWAFSPEGVPYLADAQAAIFCKQAQRISYGTHEIVIGDVTVVRLSGNFDPMVFAEGRYWRLVPQLGS